jgi:hypothetical protein
LLLFSTAKSSISRSFNPSFEVSMYLRTLIGPYAGEVFDFCPESAAAMLADGRAVKAFEEAEAPLDVVGAAPEAGEPAASEALPAKASIPSNNFRKPRR